MVIWGLAPLYWSVLDPVPSLELIFHRVVWVFLVLMVLLATRKRLRIYVEAMRSPRELVAHGLSGLFLATNWYAFVWAIQNARVVEVSLGYFVLPLFNVALGFVLFRERLSRPQMVAVALAGIGVGFQLIRYGTIPWVALVVALSFGLYAVIRKTSKLGSLTGLSVEMTLLFPLAFGLLVHREIIGIGAFGHLGLKMDFFMAGTGVLTAIPLLLYAFAARRIPLSSIGILQYIAPSLHFLLGVIWYREPFPPAQWITFGFIWVALAIYSAEVRGKIRRRTPKPV